MDEKLSEKLYFCADIIGKGSIEKYENVLIFSYKNYILEVYEDKIILKKGVFFIRKLFEIEFSEIENEYDKENFLETIKYAKWIFKQKGKERKIYYC
jgi:hypothetical protein